MNISVITPPPFEPVSLEDVYGHLRLDVEGSPPTHPDDTQIDSFIAAAREFVEKSTHRSLVTQTLRLSAAGFPVCALPWGYTTLLPPRFQPPHHIYLKHPPVQSVTSVKYYDIDNVLQTVDAARNPDFALLLELVAAVPGVARIRYTTSHPKEFSQRLIDAYISQVGSQN